MAEEDIYNSKRRYNSFKARYKDFLIKPNDNDRLRKYYCKFKGNINYFDELFTLFDGLDTSYSRRMAYIRDFKLLLFLADNNIKDIQEEKEISRIAGEVHKRYHTPKSKRDFERNIKFLIKKLLPVRIKQGKNEVIDRSAIPYPWSSLTMKSDRSRQKMRKDKLNLEEFEKLVNYFSMDPRIQAFITLAVESLARPQELLYLRISDLILNDNYAKLTVSSHGKEGVKILRCIDSFQYVAKWSNQHPLKHDKTAFLFCTMGNKQHSQLKPSTVNKHIRIACRELKISKPITCYSLKRFGVTLGRLRGDSDLDIQHRAGWTSTKQLNTYDLSNQEDSYKVELMKRGLIPIENGYDHLNLSKTCLICGKNNIPIADTICPKCKRPLNRKKLEESSTVTEEVLVKAFEKNPDLLKALAKTLIETGLIDKLKK